MTDGPLVDEDDPVGRSGGSRVAFTLNAYGVLHHSDPVPLPAGEHRVVVDVRVRPGFRWDVRLSVENPENAGDNNGDNVGDSAGDNPVNDGESAELKDVPQLIAFAPFTGISVGADKGGPVDWELARRHGSHPYRGVLRCVRYEPGAPSAESPAELARLWAEAARIYD